MKYASRFLLFILPIGILGLYCLLPDKDADLPDRKAPSAPSIVVGVNESISSPEVSGGPASSGTDGEKNATVESSPQEQVGSDVGGKNVDRFAKWFDDFHYSESQEGVSAAVDVEWSLKGPPEATPHSDILVDLWANQKYDELAAFAEERLRKDPRDKVARLLRMENAALNGSVEEYYQSCGDVLEAIKNNNPGHFSALCAILVRQIKSSLYAMEARSPEEIEKARASIRNTIAAETVKGRAFPMRVQNYIKALELDGYWGEE